MNSANNLIEDLLFSNDLIDNEINTIKIKMQLLGIDLNKKVYHDK